MPKGCLAVKKIRGHEYCYLVERVDKKVKYIYKGKLSVEEKKKYKEVKELRAKYRKITVPSKKTNKILREFLAWKRSNLIYVLKF